MAGTSSPLGIIAATGTVPLKLAQEVSNTGREVVVVALKSMADADYSQFNHHVIRLGAISTIITTLKNAGVVDVVMAGYFGRPKLASVLPDMRGFAFIARALTSGDDQALRVTRDEFAKDGLNIIDIANFMPHDFADQGLMTGVEPDLDTLASINCGVAYLTAAGQLDVGQSCVVEGRRIIAVEAAEGTDAMLERAGGLHDPDLSPFVMVKMLKTGQDRALDPPGIGTQTIEYAAKAGITCIAVQAGGVMIVNRDAALAKAVALGITLYGLNAP